MLGFSLLRFDPSSCFFFASSVSSLRVISSAGFTIQEGVYWSPRFILLSLSSPLSLICVYPPLSCSVLPSPDSILHSTAVLRTICLHSGCEPFSESKGTSADSEECDGEYEQKEPTQQHQLPRSVKVQTLHAASTSRTSTRLQFCERAPPSPSLLTHSYCPPLFTLAFSRNL